MEVDRVPSAIVDVIASFPKYFLCESPALWTRRYTTEPLSPTRGGASLNGPFTSATHAGGLRKPSPRAQRRCQAGVSKFLLYVREIVITHLRINSSLQLNKLINSSNKVNSRLLLVLL